MPSAFLTETSDLQNRLQFYNAAFVKRGVSFIQDREKGHISEKHLGSTELGFALIDSLVGYKTPSNETLATAEIEIVSGSTGNISARANGVIIGTTAWNVNPNDTAEDLKEAINTAALYTATRDGAKVIVKALSGTGDNPNFTEKASGNSSVGVQLFTSTTGDIVSTSTNFFGGVTSLSDEDNGITLASVNNIVNKIRVISEERPI